MEKTVSHRRLKAFTIVEVAVVIAVLLLLASLILPMLSSTHVIAKRSLCVNSLNQIGRASFILAGDEGGTFPAQTMVASNGWKEFLTNGNAGPECWRNFAALNNCGVTARNMVCPSDDRHAAESFTNQFDNSNVSYFVGVGANQDYPKSIAGGDRNLSPASQPHADYGYSPENGRGNDVVIPTSGTVCWSLKTHSQGKAEGAGNILVCDGHVEPPSTANFNRDFLPHALDSGNWPVGYVPTTPSIRLVFP
jgi:type II secretory pathway pseudopilin PulG